MKKKITVVLVGLLLLSACSLYAEETEKKENIVKQVASVEGRGVVNLLSTPAEVVTTMKREVRNHPRAWPVTYLPRVFGNITARVVSSVNDFAVLPWYVAAGDDTALTQHFDLPDYAWQKE